MKRTTSRGESRLARWREALIFWGVTVLVAALGALLAYQVGRNWVGKYLAQQQASRQSEQTKLPSSPPSGDLTSRVSLGPTVLIRERELTDAEKRELGLTEQPEQPGEGEATAAGNEGTAASEEAQTPSETEAAESETAGAQGSTEQPTAGESEVSSDERPAESPAPAEGATIPNTQPSQAAWQVTAGSYRDERNAQQVVQSLQAQGLSGHIEKVQVRGQTFHRVVAGSYSSKDDAQATARKVQAAGYPSQVLKKH